MRLPTSLLRASQSPIRPSSSARPFVRTIAKRTHITDPQSLGCTPMSTASHPAGPIETAIRERITEHFKPTILEVRNDSSKHAHHAPMRAINGGAGETHFSVTVVSPLFTNTSSIQRHRQINNLLKAEFALPHGEGLHALSLKAKTPEEWERETGGAAAR